MIPESLLSPRFTRALLWCTYPILPFAFLVSPFFVNGQVQHASATTTNLCGIYSPFFMAIILAIADAGLSCLYLFAFIRPLYQVTTSLHAMQQSSRAVATEAMIRRNRNACLASICSTTIAMIWVTLNDTRFLGHEWRVTIAPMGCLDVLFQAIIILYLTNNNNDSSTRTRQSITTGRSYRDRLSGDNVAGGGGGDGGRGGWIAGGGNMPHNNTPILKSRGSTPVVPKNQNLQIATVYKQALYQDGLDLNRVVTTTTISISPPLVASIADNDYERNTLSSDANIPQAEQDMTFPRSSSIVVAPFTDGHGQDFLESEPRSMTQPIQEEVVLTSKRLFGPPTTTIAMVETATSTRLVMSTTGTTAAARETTIGRPSPSGRQIISEQYRNAGLSSPVVRISLVSLPEIPEFHTTKEEQEEEEEDRAFKMREDPMLKDDSCDRDCEVSSQTTIVVADTGVDAEAAAEAMPSAPRPMPMQKMFLPMSFRSQNRAPPPSQSHIDLTPPSGVEWNYMIPGSVHITTLQ
jgi:hypothetical protein